MRNELTPSQILPPSPTHIGTIGRLRDRVKATELDPTQE